MTSKTFETRNGSSVEIITHYKTGMSIFHVYGLLNGNPCHWAKNGSYRMDGKDDDRDIVCYKDK